MKKLILAAAAALVVWNIWLTVNLYNRMPSNDNGTMVVENTVNGYSTDITEAVHSTMKSLVTVVMDDKEISGIIFAVDEQKAYIFTDSIITSTSPSVVFDSGLSETAKLIGVDPETSLTLLEVDISFKAEPVTRGSSAVLKPGEYASVVGSRRLSTGKSMVTYGVVSGEEERRITASSMYGADVIETDAIISGENVGGAMINASGELVGMGISHVVGGQEEMSYAVSVSEMKNVYDELVNDGTVTRGAAGFSGRSVNEMESYEKSQLGIGLDTDNGVIVESIYVDSPCRDLLQKGDIVMAVDDKNIADNDALRQILYTYKSGDTVTFHVIHDGSESDIQVTLA